MIQLLLLFVVLPIVELGLLLELAELIGGWSTLALILATGFLGAFLARRQGLGVLRKVRAELDEGRIPAGSIVDGIIILIAGAVLITPGVLTDIAGFLCLIPYTRRLIKGVLRRRFERAVREGRVRVSMHLSEFGPPERSEWRGELRPEPPRELLPEDEREREEPEER